MSWVIAFLNSVTLVLAIGGIGYLGYKVLNPPVTYEEQERRKARDRNRARREAGCRCGKAATDVRSNGIGWTGVEMEIWSCAEHVDVNQWHQVSEGQWEPVRRA